MFGVSSMTLKVIRLGCWASINWPWCFYEPFVCFSLLQEDFYKCILLASIFQLRLSPFHSLLCCFCCCTYHFVGQFLDNALRFFLVESNVDQSATVPVDNKFTPFRDMTY